MANLDAEMGSDAAQVSGDRYQVFLSFRGSDTRHEFTDFLYTRLADAAVCVFRDDDELPVGGVIGDNLLKAINDSTIYIPVFSRTYASSTWCLRELADMVDKESNSEGKKSILPIFFHVEPEDVKLKTSLYSNALLEHKENFPGKVKAWSEALAKVGKIKGLTVKKDTSQAKIVELVVDKVLEELKIKEKLVTEHLIGLEGRVKDLTKLLDVKQDDVRLVGIYGMAGIGKTTVAKVIFNQLSSHFEKYCSFLEGIRERATEDGIVQLQKKLLCDIVCSGSIGKVEDSEQGMRMIGKILSKRMVLIVLDDVNEKEHIKKLIGNNSFYLGSRIIITTRNKTALQIEGFKGEILPYEMPKMDDALALELFYQHALGGDFSSGDYRRLSSEIVSHAGGLPLAITVIGSSLKGKDKAFWKETLVRLTKVTEKEIQRQFTDNLKAWHLIKMAKNLKVLSLADCDGITTNPDFSKCSSLERLTLQRCNGLKRIGSFIGDLQSLIMLEIEWCPCLTNLPKEVGALVKLEHLSLRGCRGLKELPDSLGNLTSLVHLDLSGTGIAKLPNSMKGLVKLESFLLIDTMIRELPNFIGKLKSLRKLGLSKDRSCYLDGSYSPQGNVWELPNSINMLKNLEELDLSKRDEMKGEIPIGIGQLSIAAVRNIVGIDGRVKQITDLLEMEVNDEVRILGIFGTNGIGKTTLAKAVYDRTFSCFDSRSFLAEVEETTQDPSGIQVLQTRLIRDILERDREDPSFDERIEDFLDIFCERKVLLVVDDVEEQSHLRAIVGNQLHWLGPGSRIIVTSQNEGILKEYDPEKARTYPVSALEDGQAFELFCMHAFRMQSSIPDYDGVAHRIVNATGKLPLVVEVVGSFLRGKSIQEWAKMEESMKARGASSQKATVGLEEILDICYKGLNDQQKEIFLDIACFISGMDARNASCMWPSSYRPSSGCILMPLAKIGENNELQMHRLPRCLGKRILNQEESQDPSSRRFCTQDMVLKAINRETGMGNVEALCFDFTAGDSQSMPKIRFLKLDNARVSGNFAGAFASLRWLCWQRCPPEFDAENLVLRELAILELPRGKITEDWGGWREIKMPKLKVLNLTGCSDLLFTPGFSGYKDLEILILEGCSRLVKLDPSIGHLKRLVSLNLKFCSRLNWLPVELGGMTALKELFLDGTCVREMPISIGNLNQLETLTSFECFSLTHLPSSISYLTALSELSLDGAKITELPTSLGELLNLRRLSLRDCRYLEELPDSIGKMGSSLEELDISATNISELPGSIGNLESLKVLRMDSSFIRAFPGEIGNLTNLEELHASWCRGLKGAIPSDIEGLRNLRSLTLGHSRISSLPPEISTIPGLHTLDLVQCNEIEELPRLPPSLIRLRVSSKRMKVIPLLEGLKELEELCLSDGDPKARQLPSSKRPMPESNVIDEQSFSILFPKLRKLELSLSQVIKLQFGPTDDIPPLKTLTHAGSSRKEVLELTKMLSVFKLYDSAIEEIEGLEGLEALTRLEISNCRIRNLNGIGQLTSLRSLILSDCDCLSSLDLSNMKLLKVLEIRRCKMIHQIKGLDKLTSLVKPNISECPALTRVM